MVNIKGFSESSACANIPIDAYFRNKTEKLLEEIKEIQNWTLEGRKLSGTSHEGAVVISTMIGGVFGALGAFIPCFFNGSYAAPMPWFCAAQSLMSCVELDRNTQVVASHKLNKMANWYKQNAGSQDRQNLAKGLEAIVKTATEYTSSRNAPEAIASFTLFGIAIAAWYDRFQIPVFATGLALTSFFAWRHRTNTQNDLEKVRQNVDICITLLQKEKNRQLCRRVRVGI